MRRFGFAPARDGETIVFGAERPGYPSKMVDLTHVQEWITFMRARGIQRVCCLLPPKQREYYKLDLLGQYRKAFGDSNICLAEVEDYHLCGNDMLEHTILPFLFNSERANTLVVVHCSGGKGRTGHVLAASLVRHRGLSVDDALKSVIATGRDPCEAVRCGNATKEELCQRLVGGARVGVTSGRHLLGI